MSENNDNTPTPAPEAEPAQETERVAKVGVKDRDFTVTGFGGEKMSGILADLADGDD